MNYSVSTFFKAAAAAVGLAALGTASVAHARDNVYWSVGIGAAPGVSIGVGNSRPFYGQQPVYVQPAPVYVQPQPVYDYYSQAVNPHYYVQPAPVYVQPAPIYYAPAPVLRQGYGYYEGRRGHHGHGNGHGHGHRNWR